VDARAGTLRVRRGKGDRDRVVPVTWDTIRALAACGAQGPDTDWVLWPLNKTQRGPVATRTLQDALADIGHELGIVLHPHRLRHTYACELLRAGVGIYDLALLLGHSSVATTAVYLHVQTDDLAARVRAATPPSTYQLRLVA
jgi:site-specific recombinase XerD